EGQPPTTIDELDAYALKLTETTPDGQITTLGFYPVANNWGMAAWVWTFGSDFFDWETGRPTVNTPENREIVEWAREYAERWPLATHQAFLQSNGNNLQNAFSRGSVAIMLHAAT